MANFRKEILNSLGITKPADAAQELLIEACIRYKELSDRSYRHVVDAGDSPSSNALGAGNQFIRSTTEMMKILKLLGLISNGTRSKEKTLENFLKKAKVIRKK
ncbi:hypothetical protein L0244_01520 [bacterium]|nr:hypothetical protein [bacterium]